MNVKWVLECWFFGISFPPHLHPSHTKAVAWLCYFMNKFVTHFNEKLLRKKLYKYKGTERKQLKMNEKSFVPSSWFLCFCFPSFFSLSKLIVIIKVMWMLWGKCLMVMQGRANIESFWLLNYLITCLSFTNVIIFIILLSSCMAFHASLKSKYFFLVFFSGCWRWIWKFGGHLNDILAHNCNYLKLI